MRTGRLRIHRILWGFCIWNTLIAVLLGRLFLLMIFPHLHQASGPGKTTVGNGPKARWSIDAEHFHTTMVDDGRGQILFRDGLPWSHPSRVDRDGHIRTEKGRVAPELLGDIGMPEHWPVPGKVVPEMGRSGLEWSLDGILAGSRPKETGTFVTGNVVLQKTDGAVDNGGYSLSSIPGANVLTTIDEHRQAWAESLLRREKLRHGSVVSVSLPSNQLTVLASADHVRSDALHAVEPGSVFKLITAAAALDTHRFQSHQQFICDGVSELPHVRMHCWKVHGKLTFVQAIAQSCDTTFAQMGVQLGRPAMEIAARRFGIGLTGLLDIHDHPAIPGADRGVLFRHRGEDTGLLANTAIGQEDVRISPLQGAILAKTIAMSGRYERPQFILGKEQGTNTRVNSVPDPLGHQACEPFTAYTIQKGMWDAVHRPSGTAYVLHTFSIAAKTGTAELENGRVNAWLIGFRLDHQRPVEAFAFCVEDLPSSAAHTALNRMATSWFESEKE